MGPIISFFYCFLYLLISSTPLIITFFDTPPPPKLFGIEYAAAIGYLALSLMILQFATTERIRLIEKRFGYDLILQFHKKAGLLIIALSFSHPLFIFFSDPSYLTLLNPMKMPIRTVFALLSLFSLIALGLLSAFRKEWKTSYETWRVSHGFFAVSALFFGLLHAEYIDRYLNLYWKRILWEGFVAYVILHLIHARVIRPLLALRKPWEITHIQKEKGSSWTVTLSASTHKGITFCPGQFAYLRIQNPSIWFNENPFTISSSAENPKKISFTIKELGDFSRQISKIPIGTKAYVEGPYGVFSYKNFPKSNEIWMIAGGIGITPMLSMLKTLKEERDKRKVSLFFAAKKEGDLTAFDEIEALKGGLNLRTYYVVEDPPTLHPSFSTGFLTKKIFSEALFREAAPPECFICGPPPFISSVRTSLKELRIPYKKIHVELFQLV